MSPQSTTEVKAPGQASPPARRRPWLLRGIAALIGVAALVGLGAWYARPRDPGGSPPAAIPEKGAAVAPPVAGAASPIAPVRLSEDQQKNIGLRTEPVVFGASPRVTSAPGRVAPNENQYAFITPRAAGVVRSVNAHIGQEVKAGDLLATIDSPVVGEARLELYTRLQSLEIAEAQAAWQETIYANTLELLAHLQKGEPPEQVHDALQDRAVGQNRERLMTAYAQYRLGRATIARNRDLFAQKLITPKDYDQVNATYEAAQATYQSLMDEMGYEVKLENTRARQALRQTQAAVRAARERLRILGVKSDGTEPVVEGGKVVDAGSAPAANPESILPAEPRAAREPAAPRGRPPETKEAPVSTYTIWAPFDGTILDREMIIPGSAVNTTHRIFTLANLATVWIEANVHEADFEMLDRLRLRGGQVQFRSPAYPGRVFSGEVVYTGDLVEEQSRSVKLLGKAENHDRLLRPGMFVEVEVLSPRSAEVARVPASALLTDGEKQYVYVMAGPGHFERRDVDAETPRGEQVAVRSGLKAGERVVVEGAYKLKAMAVQLASSEG